MTLDDVVTRRVAMVVKGKQGTPDAIANITVDIDLKNAMGFADGPVFNRVREVKAYPHSVGAINYGIGDNDDANRFKFITEVRGALIDRRYVIYYDDKHKDLFIIPSLEDVLNGTNYKGYYNRNIKLVGVKLGIVSNTAGEHYKPTAYIDTVPGALPVASPINNTTTKIYKLPGIATPVLADYIEEQIGPNNIGVSKGGVFVVVELGSTVALFGTDIPVGITNIAPMGISNYVYDHIKAKADTLRIILPI